MNAYHVQFGPIDPLNPSHGYELRIEKNGRVILDTDCDPATGNPLKNFQDCARVLSFYAEGK